MLSYTLDQFGKDVFESLLDVNRNRDKAFFRMVMAHAKASKSCEVVKSSLFKKLHKYLYDGSSVVFVRKELERLDKLKHGRI